MAYRRSFRSRRASVGRRSRRRLPARLRSTRTNRLRRSPQRCGYRL